MPFVRSPMKRSPMNRGTTPIKRTGRVRQLRYYRRQTRKGRKQRLDVLASRFVILRDQACVTCGSTEDLQCGHYITRGDPKIRFDPRNIHAQCGACNRYHNDDRKPYRDFLVRTYGAEIFDELNKVRYSKVKATDADLDRMAEEFEEMIQTMKAAA